MAPYLLVGQGYKSEVAIRQGDAKGGVEGLQTSIQKLHAAPYELLTTPLNLSLVRGLSTIGQVDEATALIDESLGLVEKNGDQLYLPELLRMKGSLLLQSQRNRDEAAAYLMEALELSRSQGARAWENLSLVTGAICSMAVIGRTPKSASTMVKASLGIGSGDI